MNPDPTAVAAGVVDPLSAATARLTETDSLPVDAHAEVYDEVHTLLRAALDQVAGN